MNGYVLARYNSSTANAGLALVGLYSGAASKISAWGNATTGSLDFFNATAGGTSEIKRGGYDATGAWMFGAGTGAALQHSFNSGDTTTLNIFTGATGNSEVVFYVQGNQAWSVGGNRAGNRFGIYQGAHIDGGTELAWTYSTGAWTLGPASVANTHTVNGFLSKNGGGISGNATTQHPYIAIKKFTGTLDAAAYALFAHGLTAAKILYLLVSSSSFSSFGASSSTLVQGANIQLNLPISFANASYIVLVIYES